MLVAATGQRRVRPGNGGGLHVVGPLASVCANFTPGQRPSKDSAKFRGIGKLVFEEDKIAPDRHAVEIFGLEQAPAGTLAPPGNVLGGILMFSEKYAGYRLNRTGPSQDPALALGDFLQTDSIRGA